HEARRAVQFSRAEDASREVREAGSRLTPCLIRRTFRSATGSFESDDLPGAVALFEGHHQIHSLHLSARRPYVCAERYQAAPAFGSDRPIGAASGERKAPPPAIGSRIEHNCCETSEPGRVVDA